MMLSEFLLLAALAGVLSVAIVRALEAAKRPGRHVAPGQAYELGSARLPRRTSTWQALVSVGYPEGKARGWSVTHAGMGTRGTFAGDGAALDAPVSDHERAPVRLWLESRGGRVRVMVEGKGEPWRVRLYRLEEVDACRA